MMTFKQLHYQNEPLLISNVWDVPSATIAEQEGFRAIGTSSAAIATMLGYEDGEKLPFTELLNLVKKIADATTLPLTVDMEAGYGKTPAAILSNIKALAATGIAGINLEDSFVEESRILSDKHEFARTLETLKEGFIKERIELFLNVRTDTFISGHPNQLQETIARAQLYEKAGADGIFDPFIEKEADISAVVQSTSLPLNVMCMPGLPDFDNLQALGVKRISMGNFLFDRMYSQFARMLRSVKSQRNFSSVFQVC